MKTPKTFYLALLGISGLLFFFSCSTKNFTADADKATTDGTSIADSNSNIPASDISPADLAKFGFHVFAEPVELPHFTAEAIKGKNLDTTELTGTITLLNFWATWCPPCKAEMPSIERLSSAMKGTDFRIVAISTGETRKTVEDFLKEKKYSYPMYLDSTSEIGSKFATQGIPTTYLLDKKGMVIAGIVGGIEYDQIELINILKALAAK